MKLFTHGKIINLALCPTFNPRLETGTVKTGGHNIVEDRWAGMCNSHSHPRPHHTQTITTAALKMQLGQLDQHRPMDGQTDGLTDVWTKPLIEVRVST